MFVCVWCVCAVAAVRFFGLLRLNIWFVACVLLCCGFLLMCVFSVVLCCCVLVCVLVACVLCICWFGLFVVHVWFDCCFVCVRGLFLLFVGYAFAGLCCCFVLLCFAVLFVMCCLPLYLKRYVFVLVWLRFCLFAVLLLFGCGVLFLFDGLGCCVCLLCWLVLVFV